jgi:hypothetical protein
LLIGHSITLFVICGMHEHNKNNMYKLMLGLAFGSFITYSISLYYSDTSTDVHTVLSLPYVHNFRLFGNDSLVSECFVYLSCNSSLMVTKKTIFPTFFILYYIPLGLAMAAAIYISSSNKMNEFDLNNVMLLMLPHSIIICTWIKSMLSFPVAYITACTHMTINGALVPKINMIHIGMLIAFICLNCLFGIVLYQPINDYKVSMVYAISIHIILNFFFFAETCGFFKYDHARYITERDEYIRHAFVCEYENEEDKCNPDHEKYYLLFHDPPEGLDHTSFFVWYFGTGLIGRIRIFISYIGFPCVCQLLGFILYEIYGKDKRMYIVLICMSYSLWILQTVFKTILWMICIMGKYLFQYCCMVKKASVVTNDNIIAV